MPKLVNHRARTAAVAALVASMAWLVGCGESGRQTGTGTDRATARKASFDITTTATGQLEAKREVEIRSRVESRTAIVELVPEGTRVKAGDLLVRLSGDDLEQRIIEEEARVNSARADFISAQNQVELQEIENASRLRRARLKLDLAHVTMEQWRYGDYEIRKLSVNLAVEKAERELERVTTRLQNSERLYEREFLSKDELEKDRIAVTEWTAELEKAKRARESYMEFERRKDEQVKAGDVEDAEAELKRVELNNERELAVKRASLDNQREQLRIREERLRKLRDQLAATTILAPRDGLVVYATSLERGRFMDGALQVGREVQNNEQLMSLPDTAEMVAAVKVHESMAGRVRRGMRATVRVDAVVGRTFNGVVESIGVLAESTGWRDPNLREYTVRIALERIEEGDLLKPSMRAEATIFLGRVDDALSVPLQAVFNEGQLRYVYRAESGRWVRTPVRIGRRSDTFAEVLAGLSENTTVLIREPSPGEIVNRPWAESELLLAGYKLGENGEPVLAEAESQDVFMPEFFNGGGVAPNAGGMPRGPGGQGGPGGQERIRREGGQRQARPGDASGAASGNAAGADRAQAPAGAPASPAQPAAAEPAKESEPASEPKPAAAKPEDSSKPAK